MKYAVIDIGSNSVRLMLWADGTLYKKLFTTRLAAGMRDGVLQEDAMRRTAEAIAVFYREGVAEAGAARTFAFATAAVRSAKNGAAFCTYVKELCGAQIDVVSGDTEALLGAYGALGAQDGGMIDIEFSVQYLQLRYGGQYPDLLQKAVVPVLQKALEYHLIDQTTAEEMIKAYRLWTLLSALFALTVEDSKTSWENLSLPVRCFRRRRSLLPKGLKIIVTAKRRRIICLNSG